MSDVVLMPGASEGFQVFFHTFERSPARRWREAAASGDITMVIPPLDLDL